MPLYVMFYDYFMLAGTELHAWSLIRRLISVKYRIIRSGYVPVVYYTVKCCTAIILCYCILDYCTQIYMEDGSQREKINVFCCVILAVWPRYFVRALSVWVLRVAIILLANQSIWWQVEFNTFYWRRKNCYYEN